MAAEEQLNIVFLSKLDPCEEAVLSQRTTGHQREGDKSSAFAV